MNANPLTPWYAFLSSKNTLESPLWIKAEPQPMAMRKMERADENRLRRWDKRQALGRKGFGEDHGT
jgi:hypothetical protein